MASDMIMDNSVSSLSSSFDATDVYFKRGDFLRKLREMEEQDELERQLEQEQDDQEEEADADSNAIPNDTLHYETQYLNKQRYYDDYKHVNYRFIDFGYINSTQPEKQQALEHSQSQQLLPLMIEQDKKVGKGGFVWDAGFILAEHVIHEQKEWKQLKGMMCSNNMNTLLPLTTNTCTSSTTTTTTTTTAKTVQMVELGAGTGITGLYVASALPQDIHMSLTDLPDLMPLLERNIAHNNNNNNNINNSHSSNSENSNNKYIAPLPVTAFPLPWGSNIQGNYDVVLGADVVAGIYDPYKLAKTIYDLCHETTIVYLAVNNRLLDIIATFESAMSRLFEHVERRIAISRNKNPNVTILVATNKRSNQ